MTDPTCAERIADQLTSRADSVASLYDVIDGNATTDENGYTLEADEAEEALYEMPLSVELIRHVKILLGTGGPADWLDAEIDADGEIRTLEYHFADWFDHASVYVDNHSPLWRFAEAFVALEEGN